MKHSIKLILIGFCLVTVLITSYFLLSTGGYKSIVVSNFGGPNVLQVVPLDDENNNVIIIIDGSSNGNYQLKIELIYYNTGSQESPQITNEVISIPAGKVRATFVRDFYGDRKNGKVVITLIGQGDTLGEVKLSSGIF